MYQQFFGLDKLPFRLRPDPDFQYPGKEYLQSRGRLLSLLRRRSRAVLLLGSAGVGKTLLLEDVLGDLSDRFAVCRVNQPQISPTELLQAVLMQLGSRGVDLRADYAGLVTELAALLDAAGPRQTPPLLVIDDAHLLTADTMLAFEKLLTRAPRFGLLLVGRPNRQLQGNKLIERLARHDLSHPVHLSPLSLDDTYGYVRHRIQVAAGEGRELFSAEAYEMIFRQTGGVARLINVLCDAALHAACQRAAGQAGAAEVLLATQDSRWPEAVARERPGPSDPPTGPPTQAASTSGAATSGAATAGVAQIIVARGDEHIAAWPLQDGRIAIGRALDNQVCLDESFISRHHCQIVTVGAVSTIEDLGSANGICVNGQRVLRHELQPDDQITLAEHIRIRVVK